MAKTKACPKCKKIISDELAHCWDCWNEGRLNRQKEYHCKCGLDVAPFEAYKLCEHSESVKRIVSEREPKVEDPVAIKIAPEEHPLKRRYHYLEFSPEHQIYEEFSRAEWLELERQLAVMSLRKRADLALDNGDEEKFKAITEQIKEIEGAESK